MSISVTYNVKKGVDTMETEKIDEINLQMLDWSKLKKELKIGIYKSMCTESVITQSELMSLINMQKTVS